MITVNKSAMLSNTVSIMPERVHHTQIAISEHGYPAKLNIEIHTNDRSYLIQTDASGNVTAFAFNDRPGENT